MSKTVTQAHAVGPRWPRRQERPTIDCSCHHDDDSANRAATRHGRGPQLGLIRAAGCEHMQSAVLPGFPICLYSRVCPGYNEAVSSISLIECLNQLALLEVFLFGIMWKLFHRNRSALGC